LQELIAFIVIERPSPENRNNSNESGEIDDSEEFDSLDIDALSISSTDIRGRLARGERVDALLLPSVSEFIRENGLYAST
jgi:nicotinic acid mononucleotide adenylyltransferase